MINDLSHFPFLPLHIFFYLRVNFLSLYYLIDHIEKPKDKIHNLNTTYSPREKGKPVEPNQLEPAMKLPGVKP